MAANADGFIRATIEERINAQRLAGQMLEARIAAIGPHGVSRSAVSNVFDVDTCRYLTPGSIAVESNGRNIVLAPVLVEFFLG